MADINGKDYLFQDITWNSWYKTNQNWKENFNNLKNALAPYFELNYSVEPDLLIAETPFSFDASNKIMIQHPKTTLTVKRIGVYSVVSAWDEDNEKVYISFGDEEVKTYKESAGFSWHVNQIGVGMSRFDLYLYDSNRVYVASDFENLQSIDNEFYEEGDPSQLKDIDIQGYGLGEKMRYYIAPNYGFKKDDKTYNMQGWATEDLSINDLNYDATGSSSVPAKGYTWEGYINNNITDKNKDKLIKTKQFNLGLYPIRMLRTWGEGYPDISEYTIPENYKAIIYTRTPVELSCEIKPTYKGAIKSNESWNDFWYFCTEYELIFRIEKYSSIYNSENNEYYNGIVRVLTCKNEINKLYTVQSNKTDSNSDTTGKEPAYHDWKFLTNKGIKYYGFNGDMYPEFQISSDANCFHYSTTNSYFNTNTPISKTPVPLKIALSNFNYKINDITLGLVWVDKSLENIFGFSGSAYLNQEVVLYGSNFNSTSKVFTHSVYSALNISPQKSFNHYIQFQDKDQYEYCVVLWGPESPDLEKAKMKLNIDANENYYLYVTLSNPFDEEVEVKYFNLDKTLNGTISISPNGTQKMELYYDKWTFTYKNPITFKNDEIVYDPNNIVNITRELSGTGGANFYIQNRSNKEITVRQYDTVYPGDYHTEKVSANSMKLFQGDIGEDIEYKASDENLWTALNYYSDIPERWYGDITCETQRIGGNDWLLTLNSTFYAPVVVSVRKNGSSDATYVTVNANNSATTTLQNTSSGSKWIVEYTTPDDRNKEVKKTITL